MKRVIIIALCVVGILGFTSCGSTAPCGLSKAKETKQIEQNEVIVADATAE